MLAPTVLRAVFNGKDRQRELGPAAVLTAGSTRQRAVVSPGRAVGAGCASTLASSAGRCFSSSLERGVVESALPHGPHACDCLNGYPLASTPPASTGAHRDEQGVAIAVVFLFSVVALVVFQPIAVALGLDPGFAGIWSGLAVNDLSSAVAVGAQMGGAGGVMAAAAKSARILLLPPTLVVLALLRRDGGPKQVKQSIVEQLPMFVLGYVALAVVRTLGDRAFPSSGAWSALLDADRTLVDLLMDTVAASIGLHLGLPNLLKAGAPAIAVGGGASFTMAGLTLGMIAFAAEGAHAASALGSPGLRLATSAGLDVLALRVGDTFQATLEVDDRPGQGGEGAAAGRPPKEAKTAA